MDKKPWDLLYEAAQMLQEDWISGGQLFDGQRDCMATIAVITGVATDLRMRDPKERERFGERYECK